MAKLTLNDLANLQNEPTAVSLIDGNNTSIENALENTLSRDGTSPNSMLAQLDMNSNRVINLATGTSNSDAVTLAQLTAAVGSGGSTGAHGVIGPSSVTDTRVAIFDGTSGALIKDNGAMTIGNSGTSLKINSGSGATNVVYFPTGFVNASVAYGNGLQNLVHTGALEGYYNTSVGMTNMLNSTTASYNTSVGFETMQFNTTGSFNTAVGEAALIYSTTCNGNTAVGWKSCLGTLGVGHGDYNTAVGYSSLWTTVNATPVTQNTAVGAFSLSSAGFIGARNTALGYLSGGAAPMTSANDNTLIGYATGSQITTGDANTFIGPGPGGAGTGVTTGSNNVIIGNAAGSAALSSTIILADGAGSTRLTMDSTSARFTIPVDISNASSGQIVFPATQNPSANVNTLDDYEEGTFTPAITFGGAAVGVTYSTQTGNYTKIGNRVLFDIEMILTSKGSSTGSASVTGLPFTANGTTPVAVNVNNLAAAAITTIQSTVTNATTTLGISRYAAGANTATADTDYTNTSIIRLAGNYKV